MTFKKAAVTIGLGISFVGAFILGYQRGFMRSLEFSRTELTGRLNVDLAALSYLRVSETAGAIRLLESTVDAATQNLALQQDIASLEAQTLNALTLAKIYRGYYPSSSSEVTAILAQVPEPSEEFMQGCSSVIRKLVAAHEDESP